MVYVYNKISLSLKKNKILLFATTWMEMEGIMLSEISQRRTPYDFNYTWNLRKQNKRTNKTIQKQTHRYRD